MDYQKELTVAIKAVSVAASLCQTVQKEMLQSDVRSKSNMTPVTVGDYGAQAIVSFILDKELSYESFSLVAEEDSEDLRKEESMEILKRVTKLVNEALKHEGGYGDCPPLSAEDVLAAIDRGKSEGGPEGKHWILDPIDGTKGFVRGDQYAVALALLHGGKVVVGAMACPNLPFVNGSDASDGKVGCIFSAKLGMGTEMQPQDGSSPSVKVSVSGTVDPKDAVFFESFEASHSKHDLSSSIAKKLGVRAPPVRMDSQVKYGALCRGDGEIYLRFPRDGYREKIWDHAPGYIILTEAGGVVRDAKGNTLDFSKGTHVDAEKGIVVSNPELMPLILEAIRECMH